MTTYRINWHSIHDVVTVRGQHIATTDNLPAYLEKLRWQLADERHHTAETFRFDVVKVEG